MSQFDYQNALPLYSMKILSSCGSPSYRFPIPDNILHILHVEMAECDQWALPYLEKLERTYEIALAVFVALEARLYLL